MKAIHKYPLALFDIGEARLPLGAEVLTIHAQDTGVYVWALVDTEETDFREVRFEVRGTGQECDLPSSRYITTVHLVAQGLVFHIFTGDEE